MNVSIRMAALLVAGAVVNGAGTQVAWAGKPSGGGGSANYTLVRLAVPSSATNSTNSYDFNDEANVVGQYRDADNVFQGFCYNKAKEEYTSLVWPEIADGIKAQGINNSNNIVGSSLVAYNDGTEDLLVPERGLYWSSPTTPARELPPLVSREHTHSEALAINNAKIIVGISYRLAARPYTPGREAIVAWYVDADGTIHAPVELPFLPSHVRGQVADLNEATEGITTVVGTSGDSNAGAGQEPRPVSWTVAVVGNALIVTGPVELAGGYEVGEARGVNLDDTVVGMADFGLGGGMPFIQPAGQVVQPLPLLDRGVTGDAHSINNAGQIVGSQGVYQNKIGGGIESRAVLWTSAAAVVDLNSQVSLGRGERLWSAYDINKNGDILAIINGSQSCLLIAK